MHPHRRVGLLALVATWVTLVAAWAYVDVTRTLSGPRLGDAYAYTVEFQLLAFAVVRLPLLLVLLPLGFALVVLLTPSEDRDQHAG
jgi:hypothetical protein